MAPDLRAGGCGELTSEMPDPTRGAVNQHLATEQQPALAECMQCGEARDRQRTRHRAVGRTRARHFALCCGTISFAFVALFRRFAVARQTVFDSLSASAYELLAGENPSWSAVWTSLLFGNSRLFRPTVPFWTFAPPVAWAPFRNFYETCPMERTLAELFDPIGPRQQDPRLILTAVDLQKIRVVAFDSYEIAVTPRHVVASCSLPPSFPETEIDGHSYWDGGLWSNTPLKEVLDCLRA